VKLEITVSLTEPLNTTGDWDWIATPVFDGAPPSESGRARSRSAARIAAEDSMHGIGPMTLLSETYEYEVKR
jgi:hypothetical protein